MAKKPESRLQKRIQAALKARWPKSFWIKHHGGPFSAVGIPDLIGVVNGKSFWFEVKLPGKLRTLSPLQAQVIHRLQEAGAIAAAITSPEEALALVEAFSPPPEARCTVRPLVERVLSRVRAEDGKDLVRWGIPVATGQRVGSDRRLQK